MIKNLIICSLLCLSTVAADPVVVTGSDGKHYKLVKPETKLSTGAKEIAEYVRVGDKKEVRYGMHLAPNGAKPSFWKIQG